MNGTEGVDMDFTATKAALSSASTTFRQAHLHTLEERLANNGRKTLMIL